MWNKNTILNTKGFSLVEVLISTAIFTFIMVVAIGAFMTSSKGAKESKALRIAMDNVNFAMDNITRELRVGFNYSDNSPNSQISFTPYDNSVPKRYFYLDVPSKKIYKCDHALPPDTSAICASLVSPQVEIVKLQFDIYDDSATGQLTQPSVYIQIEGQVNTNGVVESFELSTLASQRNAE